MPPPTVPASSPSDETAILKPCLPGEDLLESATIISITAIPDVVLSKINFQKSISFIDSIFKLSAKVNARGNLIIFKYNY
jgi:hypothetical protein